MIPKTWLLFLLFGLCACRTDSSRTGLPAEDTAEPPATDSVSVSLPPCDSLPVRKTFPRLERQVPVRQGADVPVTEKDLYRVRTQQAVYPADTKQIEASIYNFGAFSVTAGHYSLQYRNETCWETFPFREHLIFTDVAYEIRPGGFFSFSVPAGVFASSFKAGTYRLNTYVLVELYRDFAVKDENSDCTGRDTVQPLPPFGLQLFPACAVPRTDTVVLEVSNRTNLPAYPAMYPILMGQGPDGRPSLVHPLLSVGTSEMAERMRTCRIAGGASLRFYIPLRWKTSGRSGALEKERFQKGRLDTGRYTFRVLLEVQISTEFRIE